MEKPYEQAVKAGWLQHSEANVRNFACAALRASRAGGRVGAIFVGIVKNHLWNHITQEQENRALQVLKRFRERQAGAFGGGGDACGKSDEHVSRLVHSALAKSCQATPFEKCQLQRENAARQKLLAQARGGEGPRILGANGHTRPHTDAGLCRRFFVSD